MAVSQQELEARYAEAASAGAARFLRAKHVPDALAKLGLIGPQDHLVVCADDFQDAFIERFPRESLFFLSEPSVDAFAAAPVAAGEGRTFWFVNSIGGRGLRVPDMRSLAKAAHAADAYLLVDNTVPSAFGCRPLELDADACFEALDRVAGGKLAQKAVAVAWRKKSNPLLQTNYAERPKIGGQLKPQLGYSAYFAEALAGDVAVIAAGLDSLSVRMQHHFDRARAIAEYLSCCDAVPSVAYPGLAPHPDHALAANVLRHGYGPSVDFELPASVSAAAFIARCALDGREHPAGGACTRLSARDGDEARFIRLFAGLDDPLAIADDLDQALRWFCNPPEP